MLKKVLCWLLIIQHFNVYVLKASFGDIQVIFEGEAPSRSLKIKSSHALLPSKPFSSRRLKLFREVDEFGRKEEFFNQLFKVEGVRQFRVVQFDSLKERNIRVKTSHTRETIHVSLTSKGDNFSLHLYPDGRTLLQAMELSRHLDVETFGDIYVAEDIKAEKLTLTGRNIRNQGLMSVEDLSLTALGTPESVGKIINASSGRIVIGGETKVFEGHFENQGRIMGTHGGVLDLCGNDFTNGYIGQTRSEVFKTQLTWEGQFSILNGGVFINDSDICSQHTIPSDKRVRMPRGAEECDLKIETRSFWNRNDAFLKSRGRIFSSHNLEIICEEDFVNEGTVQGQHQVSLDVARALANLGLIESEHILKLKVGQLLFNANGARLKSNHTEIDVMGMTRNEGHISSRFLTLETGSLFNFSEIGAQEKGHIQEKEAGKGLYNIKGAKITSEGELMIQGQTLMNQGEEGSKGLIKAKKLQTLLSHMENEGTIVVKEQGNLQANSLVNRALGTLSFVKEGIVSAQTMINEGSIVGKILTFFVDILENYKSISGLENLFVGIKTSLVNGKNALLLSLRKLVIEGTGEFLNEGQVTSKEHVKINLRQLRNHAQMISEARMDVEAQQFENAGLVIAPQLSFVVDQGSNSGSLNETIDLSNLKNLTGILALDELHLTTREAFFNRGHTFGQNRITLEGKGTFENEQRLETEGQLDSHVRKFKNSGFVRSYANLTFDGLEEGLENSGNILSLGDLKVTASHMVNNGEIDVGDATFELQKLSNLGNFSSSGSVTGTLGFFRNTGAFFSAHFLDLTVGRLENAKLIQSKNRLKIVATKDSLNEGTIEASSVLQIDATEEFLNQGFITSLDSLRIDSQSNFENVGKIKAETNLVYKGNGVLAQKGEFFSQGNILIRAKRLSHNNVIYAGGKLAAKVDEWFENERLVFGAKGIKIYAGAIYNSGQFETLAHLFLKSKRRTENHGTLLAKTASLGGEEFAHYGTFKADEDSTLDFRKIQTFKKSLLSSHAALHFTGDEFVLEGDLNAGAVVDFKGRLLTNRGDVQSAILTATLGESFTNFGFFYGVTTTRVEAQSIENTGELSSDEDLSLIAKTLKNLGALEAERKLSLNIGYEGTNHKILKAKSLEIKGSTFENFSFENVRAEEVDIEVQKLTNTGGILSETTKIVADAIENFGILTSSTSMVLKVLNLLKNAKDAVIVAGERLVANIEEVLDSEGLIYGEQGLMIEAGQIVNTGQFETLKHLSLKSKTKTENHGTFLAKTASLEGDELVHHGIVKTDEDSILNFRKIQTFKESLLSSTTALYFTGDEFILEGDVSAASIADFKGRFLTNRGEIQSTVLTATLGESFTNTRLFHGLTTTLEAQAVVNEGEISSDEALTVTVGSLTNLETLRSLKGLTLKVGHLLKNAKDAVIVAGEQLVADIEEVLDSEGLIYGEQGLTIEAGQIVNKGQFETLKHLSLKSKTKTENHGTLLAKTASLGGEEFSHYGTFKVDEDSVVNFRKIQTFKKSLLSSHAALHFTGDEFVLEGDLNARAVVDFKGRLLTNRGEIQGAVLTAVLGESFTNTGFFHGLTTTRIIAQSVENTGELSSGEDLSLTARTLANLGTLEAERKLFLNIGHEGINHKILKAKSLEIKGGVFSNLSPENVRAEEVDIEVLKLTNKGGILSETTKIVADVIENLGMMSTSRDMNIDVRHLFKNAKDAVIIVAREFILKGTGKLKNAEEADIRSEGTFVSHLPEVENAGSIRAKRGITFDHLMKELKNVGLILSEAGVEITSQSSLFNGGRAGIIEARKGPLTIKAQELVNHRLINALDGLLTLNITRGENHNTFYGHAGIDLTFEDSFANHKIEDAEAKETIKLGILRSPGLIRLSGAGSFTNHAFIASDKDVQIDTDFTNHGEVYGRQHIVSITRDKQLTNESEGVVVAGEDITFTNGRSFINKGHIQGAKASFTTMGEFKNEGALLTTTEDMTLILQAGKNTGTIYGKQKVELSIEETLENEGQILSPKTVDIHGTGKLKNAIAGTVNGDEELIIQEIHLENEGTLESSTLINLRRLRETVVNASTGRIHSVGILNLRELSAFHNFGHVQGDIGTDILALNILNRGMILSSEGSLRLACQEGVNGETGQFKAKETIEFNVQNQFFNEGVISAEKTLVLSGKGRFINHNSLKGLKKLSIELPSFTNRGEVHSEHEVVIHETREKLENSPTGKISSDGILTIKDSTTFENAGEVEAGSLIEMTLPDLKNVGRILSDGGIVLTLKNGLNGAHAFITAKADVVFNLIGELTNEGEITAE
ncbi:MAG: hypothetical protein JSR85_06530, partial [Proteobacteria bacterium]|nr:hypothetical protein [Pseudomonadota bacterium]